MNIKPINSPHSVKKTDKAIADKGYCKTANRAASLRAAQQKLSLNSATAHLDAELLLCDALNITKTQLATWPNKEISESQYHRFQSHITRRGNGEPIAYILGTQSFWTLELVTTPSVLIPRPETELLVEATLEHIKPNQAVSVLDLGTGSGAIALAIAQERKYSTVIGIDISESAIKIATINRKRHKLKNVFFNHSKWASSIKNDSIDIIVSNPPYIETSDPHLEQGDLRFEPKIALVSGENGFDDIDIIIEDSKRVLHKGGWLLLEHGWKQGQQSQQKLHQAGYQNIRLLTDLNGHARVSIGQRI